MRMRFFLVLCLGLVLVSFSGCPSAAGFPIALGNWLFAFPGTNDHLGLGILANGEANTYSFSGGVLPVGAGAAFAGSLTWQQVGNTITMAQSFVGGTAQYTCTLQSSTFMTGTRTSSTNPNNPVPFTASKAPSENLK